MSEAEEGSAELALETVRRRILLSTVFDRLREEENKREKLDLLFFLFAFASCSLLLLLLLLSFPLDRVRSRTGFIPFYKCGKRLILLLLLLLVQSKKDGKQDNEAVDATSLLPFFFLSLTPSSRYLSSPWP